MLDLLGKNKLDSLFNAIQAKIEEDDRYDLRDELYLQKGRYHDLKNLRQEGTISEEDWGVGMAKIRKALPSLIQKLFQPRSPLLICIKGKPKWIQLVLVGSICILLMALGSIRTSSVRFNLNLDSTFVAFRLAESWDVEQYLFVDNLEVFPVVEARVDTSSWLASDHGDFGVRLTEGRTQIANIPLPSQSALGVSLDYDEITIRPHDTALELTLNLQKSKLELPELGYEKLLGDTSEAAILEIKTAEVPELSFTPKSDVGFEIKNKAISDLDFLLINRQGDTPFSSAISAGMVSISGSDYELSNQPFIDFKNLKSARLTLNKSESSLKIEVSGKAQDVQIGPSKEELQSINPTYIEYFAGNEYANLFWNAIVLIIGTSWSILKVLKKDQS